MFKHPDGDVTITKYNNPDYVLADSDVPEDPTKANHTFEGWSKDPAATEGEERSYFVGKKISEVEGTWYPVFAEIPDEYTVAFKYTDGSEALPTVTKTLAASEDYELAATDVKDVAHPTAPADYEFLGWTTTVDGTDYIASSEIVGKSIKDVDGTVYYAQFKKITDNYTVAFKYTDGSEALPTVTKTLAASEDYELAATDVKDVAHPTAPADYEFLGWTTTVDGTDYIASSEIVGKSIKTVNGTVYYAQFKHIDDVEYYVEHYFEQPDGTYALYSTDTLYAKPETVVTATALDPLPEGFKEENTAHADRVSEGTVPEKPDVLTLKLYYYSKVITVRYFDLAYDAEEPVYEYEVKYGGTVDNFTYPGTEYSPEDNEDIKTELAEYLEYLAIPGYGKDYDEAYFYNKFEDELDGYYYYEFGKNGLFEHEINYKWYVEDAELEYVLFDEAHEFTEDLDLFSKVKKLNVVIGFPTKLTDKVLTINIPYEESTRFLDSIRDALFINNQIAGFPELIGIEDKLYDKLSDVGTKFFGEDGIFNSDNEINNVNMLVRFSRLMGEAEFKKFLDSFYDDEAAQTIEQYLHDYIMTHETESTAEHLKELLDDLVGEHSDLAHELIADLSNDIIKYEITFVEEFFKSYITGLVNSTDSEDKEKLAQLEDMLCEVLADYKKEHENEFIGFATEVIVNSLADDEPSATIKGMLSDYIKKEIKNKTYNDEIIKYVLGMSPSDFKSAAWDIYNKDSSIIDGEEIKNDVKNKILTDNALVQSVIVKLFDIDNSEVDFDSKIESYIKKYNLADEFIKNNPDKIVDYIPEEKWEELSGGLYDSSFSRDDKIEALKEYIADNPDTAISKLKSYAGSSLDSVISDYLANNRDDIEDDILTEVLTNDNLREELANYAVQNMNNNSFGGFLDAEINQAIDEYLDEVAANDAKKTSLVDSMVVKICSNDAVYNLPFVQDAINTVINDVIADIAANENDNIPDTESKYVADIRKYAKSLTEFDDLVSAVISSDETFRNQVIDDLFDNLYLVDPDHSIILDFMQKLTDKMIEDKNIDINMLITIIDYIKQAEHGEDLAWDIVNNLMELGDELLDYAKEHLGFIDETGGKLEATLKFRDEVTNDEQFEVTADNLFIMDMVKDKVESMTFDSFLDEFVASRVPETLLDKLPLGPVERIYNDCINDFLDDLNEARTNVENEVPGPHYVNSGVVVDINIVSDLLIPAMDFAEEAHTKAVNKAVASGNKAAELVEKYYVDNPYVVGDDTLGNKGVVNYGFDYTLYISDEDNDGFYTINSFKDIYNNVVKPMSVESIDALLWMMDEEGGNVNFARIKELALDNEDLVLALYNHPNELMARYAQNGLPEDMIEYYEDLLENDEIRKAVEKLDNKVDNYKEFDMMFFVESKLQNATLEMYYLKVLDRVGVPVQNILDKYTNSKAYKELTSAEYRNLIEQLDECWGDDWIEIDGVPTQVENYMGTTDYVFDNVLEKVGNSDDDATLSVKGFEMSITRFFADMIETSAPDYTIVFKDSNETNLALHRKVGNVLFVERELPEVTAPEGYVFAGWSTVNNSDIVEFTNELLVSGNGDEDYFIQDMFASKSIVLYPVFVQ